MIREVLRLGHKLSYQGALQAVPLLLPLYLPGSTPSKVKGTESLLPASCRLRFSPWRLTDCSVTIRSPHASGRKHSSVFCILQDFEIVNHILLSNGKKKN